MRSSSLRPSGVPTAWVHISRPSLADSAVRVPSSLPTNRTPGPTSTGALPRTVRLGSSLVQNQRRSPVALLNAVTRPSLLRTKTFSGPTAGAATTSLGTLACHFSAPVVASRATTWPSSVPTTTSPCPAPGPPEKRRSDLYCQTCLPVCRSKARTPPSTAAAYTRPPSTTGVCCRPRRPSPLPALALQSFATDTVGVMSISSAGSVGFSSAFLPPNHPLIVLQPPSAPTSKAATRTRDATGWARIMPHPRSWAACRRRGSASARPAGAAATPHPAW